VLASLSVILFSGDSAASLAARQIHARQSLGDVQLLLKDVDLLDVPGESSRLLLFFANGEYWTVKFTDDAVAQIDLRPDCRPFLERARRAFERRVREISRRFR
jgi:hypothetical protein